MRDVSGRAGIAPSASFPGPDVHVDDDGDDLEDLLGAEVLGERVVVALERRVPVGVGGAGERLGTADRRLLGLGVKLGLPPRGHGVDLGPGGCPPGAADRGPLGQEATISWGGPELIFRNDWPAAVLITLDATKSSFTVRFFSSRLGKRVETETFALHGHGGGGFTVEYTRRVYRGERLLRNERYRVSYASPRTGRRALTRSSHATIEGGAP